MKTLILIVVALMSSHTFACRNSVPESEAKRYIAASPNGVPALYTCADKPEEPCLCFDNIEGWDVAEVKDVEEVHINPTTKEESRSVTRKIVNNTEKLAAKRQRLEIEASNEEISDSKKKLAREKFSVCTKAYMSTVAKTAECLESVVEVLK